MTSKQEQQVVNILNDNIAEMCELYRVPGDLNLCSVAKEIAVIFEQPHKDTRSRRERKLDELFAAMGIKPRVYHFTKEVKPLKAVTIATERHTWDIMNGMLICMYRNHNYPWCFHPATALRNRLRKGLQNEGVYGVAICDKQDHFNKRTGRNKAKGRLMQHLLREAQKE